MKKRLQGSILLITTATLLVWRPIPARAGILDNSFTYQGQLTDTNGPVNGAFDFRFRIFNVSSGGSNLGSITNSGLAVSNGLFTTSVLFSNVVFDGTAYWLDIGVRTNGSAGGFTLLAPRQLLSAVPNAMNATNANYAVSAGTAVSAGNATAVAANAITTAAITNGAITSSKLATNIAVWTQTPTNIYYNGGDNVGIGTATPGADLEISGGRQEERLRFSGPEFYQNGHTDTNGVSFLLGVNRTGNRQLWLGDSANLARNSTNTVLQFQVGQSGSAGISALGTDGATVETLSLGSAMTLTPNGDVNIGTSANYDTTVASRVLAIAGNPGATNFPNTSGVALDDNSGNVWAMATFTDGDLHIFKAAGNGGTSTLNVPTLNVNGEATCTAINITSDRNAKEAFKPVNTREVLEKVARLPISEWQYKTASDARHLGPMAQDFRAAFALGHDDRHITTVDEEGVALAAIQGLNEKLEEQLSEKDARIGQLEKSVAELKTLVSQLARPTGDTHAK